MISNFEPWIAPTLEVAQAAGAKILEIYHRSEQGEPEVKPDGSPLTLADKVSHALITDALQQLPGAFPVLSEETTDIPFAERAEWQCYWLVDPLDGTKEFIHRTGEFTVNIALVQDHHAMLGVVLVPLTGELYFACKGQGAFKRAATEEKKLQVHPWQGECVKIISSRRHGEEELAPFLKHFKEYEITHAGSALKFCRVAEGLADIYPRLGTTSEWDTAAAQCILEEAGGVVLDFYGHPLQYNTRDSLQNPYFIAIGDANHPWLQYFKIEDIYQ